MIVDAEHVLRTAHSRMAANAPAMAATLDAWFEANHRRLLAWARVAGGTASQLGAALQPDSANPIVEELLGRVEAANPEEGAWGRRYQGLLELLVRVILESSLARATAIPSTAPVVLPIKAAERIRINVLASQIAAAPTPPTPQDVDILRRYTGMGGLSFKRVEGQIPAELVPDTKALVDEFYTLPEVCAATAEVIATLAGPGGLSGPALEPAAGIGRFVGAFRARPDMAKLEWTAVEYSALSARILGKLYPEVSVFNLPFEKWIADHFNDVAGTFSLVVTNPPYGQRGKNKFDDPDKSYREDTSYPYFVRRPFDLLKGGGLGVALVPYGFLSGHTPSLRELRRKVLLRHHLLVSYRLPSNIYPGANIVTDLSFWRARGGELDAIPSGDELVLEGDYFKAFPGNILGPEETSARGRYEVKGDFTRLPPPQVREDCSSCPVRPFLRALAPVVDPEEGLDARLKIALTLAKRVNEYLDLAGSAREVDKQRALDLHGELTAATAGWLAYNRQEDPSYAPAEDRDLNKAAGRVAALAALLSVFEPGGALKPAFLAPPKFEPAYQGIPTIIGHAQWLYEKRRSLTIKELLAFRVQQGMPPETGDDLVQELASQGWCEDWSEDGESSWLPPTEYYSGDLWPRFRRAKAQSSPRALAQLAKMRQLMGTVSLEEANPTPRDTWVPADAVQAFLTENLTLDVPALQWSRAQLKPVGADYFDIAKLDKKLQIALGYINHDLGFFQPDYKKDTDPASGEEESSQQALDRVRLAYGADLTRQFRQWLDGHPTPAEAVCDAYSLRFRGYILPTYGMGELPIARWGKRISLKPHQRAGAWRLIRNNGGLLAFDVGVGKTYTGIATLAYLRQIGRARRPVIVVPNTIVWKWKNEFAKALPDYRVVVIGSEQYKGKDGTPRAKLDEKADRLRKWSEFKLGLYDVAIVAFSVLSKTHVTEESLRQFLEETPTLLREVGFKSDDLREQLEKLSDLYEQRSGLSAKRFRLQGSEDEKAKKELKQVEDRIKRLDKRLGRLQSIQDRLSQMSTASERNRAILQESINEWIAGILEGQDSDGLEWESLKCDLLMLDEAQNMKNLWTVGRREGGVPKYLGAISEGSDRAFDFAIRSFLTQKETKGSGVVLLSATPAKNSPLEYFTLLGFVDHYCWTKRGILDPDYFIDRYLRLQMRSSLRPNGTVENRTAVVGFMALNELRDILFKYGDFKNADDVGLVRPDAPSKREFLPMNEEQRKDYQRLRGEYEEIVSSREGMREKHKLLGLLQKMALVAIHPELGNQPEEGWSWDSAGRFIKNKSSPKLAKAVAICKSKPGCGHIIFCDNVAVHRCLFDLLVEAGIPAERIAVLNAERAPTGLKRQEIADGFNGTPTIVDPETGRIEQEGIPPKYDIVIANAVAYEGIDLQIRTCVVTHIDLPYEPATLQQRNGRAVRQYNQHAVVEIFYLLSDKSYDAIKLTMITGKLRWMSDILRGSDRETNNPAADMDMSTDDFLLLLADDPEAAKVAMEEVKKRNELERKAQAAFQAWLRLGQLIGKVKTSEASRDEGTKEQARQEALDLQRYLQAVPPETWPWLFVTERVLAGTPTITVAAMEEKRYSFRAIWEGLGLLLGADSYVYFGAVRNGGFSYRDQGSHLWQRAVDDPEKWAILAEVPPAAFLEPPRDDRAEWEASLGQTVESLRYNGQGLKAVGLWDAPDAWAQDVWARYGERIVTALSLRGTDLPQRADETVSFSTAIAGGWVNVLPPTDAGYAEFLRRVTAGKFTYGEMQERAKAWWHRDFPKGVADDRAILTVVGRDGVSQNLRAEATYRQLYSVAELPSVDRQSRSWALVALPGGRQLDLEPFFNLDNAKLAARWLAELSNSEQSFSGHNIGSRRTAIVNWIAEQVELPTLASVQARYAAGIG